VPRREISKFLVEQRFAGILPDAEFPAVAYLFRFSDFSA
jgi:hypothetical protein